MLTPSPCQVFGVILSATYIVAKGNDLMRTTTLAKDGCLELFKIVVSGNYATVRSNERGHCLSASCHWTPVTEAQQTHRQ